jgi:hypothetical protein
MKDLNKLPIPEFIDGKQWDVGEAVGHHAGTDRVSRKMFVPVDTEACETCGLDHDRYIRVHELTHAKHSPRKTPGAAAAAAGVGTEAFILAEENFIEAIALRSYPDLQPGLCETWVAGERGSINETHELTDKMVAAIRQGRIDIAARIGIAGASGASWRGYEFAMDKPGLSATEKQTMYALGQFCDLVKGYAQHRKPTLSTRRWLAQTIEKFLGTVDEAQREAQERGKPGDKPGEDKKPGHGKTEEKKEEIGLGRMLSEVVQNSAYSGGPARWPVMRTVFPPRPINLNKKLGVRKYRATPEGARIRNMSRYFTDQKVFGRKRKHKGGTLLVDASGSMSFSQADMENILHGAPATTIAMYSGWGSGGELRIIAKGGTCVEAKGMKAYGGNEVDGPALDWLAKQREPRIWLSDGEVFGSRGDCKADASAKCRKGNIRRVRWLEQAICAYTDPTVGVRSSYADDDVDMDLEEWTAKQGSPEAQEAMLERKRSAWDTQAADLKRNGYDTAFVESWMSDNMGERP